MDAVRVEDLGTSFSVQAMPDSVFVFVTAGKVAVTQKSSGESRAITAGGSICLYTRGVNSGEIRETAIPPILADSLHFDNAPLSEVLTALEKRSGRVIRLTDSLMGQKRLTIKLGDESLEDALRLVCASMHLTYTLHSGEYLLVKTDSAAGRK
jgi:ferric-dicitrate binding protein FerR (iron transport regulator)